MGAYLCKEQTDTRPGVMNKLTVWGDYVNADTKAILSVLKLCNVEFEYTNIETLKEEHKRSEEFAKISPVQEIPVLTEGSYKIISGATQFMFYLCNTRAKVKDTLYPKDCERVIN